MASVNENPFVHSSMQDNLGTNKLIKSTATNGKRNLSNAELRSIRNQTILSMAKKTGIFEMFWYPTFFIGGLLCLILVRPINLELILCVTQLWLCMVANNLAARGIRWGLLLNTISMCLYVYVSIINKVWGEVIINVCMYIPFEIIGFIKWKQASESNSSNLFIINKFTGKQWLMCVGAIIGMTGGIFALLHFGLNQSFAIFNALCIATCLIGNFVRNRRYIETWPMFILGNMAGIALWACQVFFGGEGISLSVLPLILSYSSTLTNDFNGWAIWAKMLKKQDSTDRVYLAKRKINVTKLAKLKQTYQKFRCAETSDVSGEEFRKI